MTRRSATPISPRRIVAAFVAALAVLLGTPAYATAAPTNRPADDTPVSWGAAPADTAVGKGRSRFSYTLAPGSRVSDALAVVNRSDTTIKLKVYASDAFTTPSGGIDLLTADKKPRDVGSWITMKSTTLTLKSQQSATVPFTLTVPSDATPGDHSGGVLTSLVTETQGRTVRLDRRLGSRLYLRVNGPLDPSLTVGDLHASYQGTLDPAGSGSLRVTYTVENTGNVRLKARQLLRAEGLFGLIGQDAGLPDLPEILPGNSLTRTVTVNGIWPGVRLDTDVILQPLASDDQPALRAHQVTASRSLWAWPWGQLIVLAALATSGGAYALLRRRRRRKVERAIADAVAKALGTSGTRSNDPQGRPSAT
ncbi:WxL protein peptidoglycan domain-containing protein [Actinacidiphila glaucinigra]|uniref:WxL Interacting Protein peptidoglycan binding domain-containing protein n=1 Tax=Actinacidiphila glaucinigra TaxID=235986 RepID=A0A239P162_9ACTN|nr:DUF916 domain-containing protein [Actinacidiphila glaucinigra]SNT60453.1 protein of unknown function [Actinacidiphila glaucinigra]